MRINNTLTYKWKVRDRLVEKTVFELSTLGIKEVSSAELEAHLTEFRKQFPLNMQNAKLPYEMYAAVHLLKEKQWIHFLAEVNRKLQ